MPRLELCGALLLAELVSMVARELGRISISCDFRNVILWSDSSIVLAWIKSDKQLKAYVSNRVAQILDLKNAAQWRHVPTASNPADLSSRGCSAEILATNELWWKGPTWLGYFEERWPPNIVHSHTEVPELRIISPVQVATQAPKCLLKDKYSSLSKLNRITA